MPKKEIISTGKVTAGTAPLSQATRLGNLVFVHHRVDDFLGLIGTKYRIPLEGFDLTVQTHYGRRASDNVKVAATQFDELHQQFLYVQYLLLIRKLLRHRLGLLPNHIFCFLILYFYQ